MSIKTSWLIGVIVGIVGCRASIITCDSDKTCFNTTVTCPVYDDCHIVCNGNESCALATIKCPESQSAKCTLDCNGDTACDSILLYGQKSYSLAVNATGRNALSFSEIHCPHSECDVQVNGVEICTKNSDLNLEQCSSINHCWSQSDTMASCQDHICTVYETNKCSTNQPLRLVASGEDKDIALLIVGILVGIFFAIFCCSLCLRFWCSHRYGYGNDELKIPLRMEVLNRMPSRHSTISTIMSDISDFTDPRNEGLIKIRDDPIKPMDDNENDEDVDTIVLDIDNIGNTDDGIGIGEFVISDESSKVTSFH